MTLVQTKSFQLATYSAGSKNATKLALVLPGKLDTKDYSHMRSHVDFLASRGYFAVTFDPPGTWESPGDLSLYTMTSYAQAINELIEYFGNKPTFLMGHSRGGSMAMLVGTQNPAVTHFASIMSYYSFDPTILGKFSDEKWREDGFHVSRRDVPGTDGKEKREFKLPYSFLQDQIQYDMHEALKHSTKPKLFVLGLKDTLVNPEIVRTGYECSAPPKELRELDSEHDYRNDEDLIDEVNGFLRDFLEKYHV